MYYFTITVLSQYIISHLTDITNRDRFKPTVTGVLNEVDSISM